METKSIITLVAVLVLVGIGSYIVLGMFGYEFDFGGGYTAQGSSYYGGEPATGGEGGGGGFDWGTILLVLVAVAAFGSCGWVNRSTIKSKFLWPLHPGGRKEWKEKRRKRKLKEEKDLEELRNLLEKGEGVLTGKLDDYKKEGDWVLLSLFREEPKPIMELNDEEYRIKVVRHTDGIKDDKVMIDKIINTHSSDLKKDWKFGVYTDNISDDQMEFVFLHAVIRWCYDRIHRNGEMPEMAKNVGHLNIFKKFMGPDGKRGEEFYESDEAEFDSFKSDLTELLELYNEKDTKEILSACSLNPKDDFDVEEQPQGSDKPYATMPVDNLLRIYEFAPFRALHLYTIHGGASSPSNLRKMLEFTSESYETFDAVRDNISNIVEHFRSQNVDEVIKKALTGSKPGLVLKKFKKGFSEHLLGNKDEIVEDLKRLNKLQAKMRQLAGEDFDWWTQRKFEPFAKHIKDVLKQQYGYEEWTGSYDEYCPGCSESIKIDDPITEMDCPNCGEDLNDLLPTGWYPKDFHKRIALLYSTIFIPWMYTLATYKLFYTLVLKYMDSIERVKELVEEGGELYENS